MSLRSALIARVSLAWLVAFAALVALAAGIQGFRGTVQENASVSAKGSDLRPNSPQARVEGTAIYVGNARPVLINLLQIPTEPFQAANLTRLRISAGPVPENIEVALLWVRRTEPGRVREQRLSLDGARYVAVALLDLNPDWRGEIASVALGVKGESGAPWRIEGVVLDSAGIGAIAAGIFREWFAFAPWDGRSINVAFGGSEFQHAWMPLLAFTASLLALAYVRRHARREGRRADLALLALPFVLGWLALDLRWSTELTRRAFATAEAFGGKSYDERRLTAEDGDLYRVVAQAKALLPGVPERVFVNSDFDYFRMRAAYHFYPHNVLAFGWHDGSVMRPGDVVFLYQKSDVRFDATAGALIWPDGSRTSATALIARTGVGLFRVR